MALKSIGVWKSTSTERNVSCGNAEFNWCFRYAMFQGDLHWFFSVWMERRWKKVVKKTWWEKFRKSLLTWYLDTWLTYWGRTWRVHGDRKYLACRYQRLFQPFSEGPPLLREPMTYCSVGNAGHLKDFHVRKSIVSSS